MRKKSIWVTGIVLVILLLVSLGGTLTYYSNTAQVEKAIPAETVDETSVNEDTNDAEAVSVNQEDENYITLDEDAVPAAAGAGSDLVGMSDGVAFDVLGIVAGVMGIAAVAAIIGVVISKRKNS